MMEDEEKILTVAELIAALRTMPLDAEVYMYEGGIYGAQLEERGYVELLTGLDGTP